MTTNRREFALSELQRYRAAEDEAGEHEAGLSYLITSWTSALH